MIPAKKILIPYVLLLLVSPVFSEEEAGETVVFTEPVSQTEAAPASDSGSLSGDDDFDSVFEGAEDTEEAVVTEQVRAGTDYNVQLGSIKFPLEISGKMSTEVGTAYIREFKKNDATVYFDFKNYIYFTTRPDKYLALKGVLKTSMPDDSNDSESNQLFYLYEMYFEYLFWDRIYFTAGKKKSVWGNIRLFSDAKDYQGDSDALYTNLLYDSREQISGIFKIPVGNHTFTALALYNVNSASGNSPGTKDMSLAANAEFVLLNTSLNFFGRRFPMTYGTNSNDHQLTVAGLEFKKTVFGFDMYGQTMGRVLSGQKAVKKMFTSKFSDWSSFNRIISTGGIYRIWNDTAPYVGFNFELQNIYRPEPGDGERFFTNRIALHFAMSKLGPNKDIKIGTKWSHNIDEKTGVVEPGIIFSRVLPHCDWKNGFKLQYGDSTSYEKYKLTIGTYLTISMDY